ncbi:hypothetical protein Ae717Ps2_6429 [Pseudonocardia sp. Ae717_Ps2]|nr:hypothetical protein Ae717Ps2_6429 [Pseudonocardia sp. Ae717_Ps2]
MRVLRRPCCLRGRRERRASRSRPSHPAHLLGRRLLGTAGAEAHHAVAAGGMGLGPRLLGNIPFSGMLVYISRQVRRWHRWC